MSGFIEGQCRAQGTLFPESLDEYIAEENEVRAIDVFIDDLDLAELGFRAEPSATGGTACHARTMLKLYVYGYLNRVQSSRRLEARAVRRCVRGRRWKQARGGEPPKPQLPQGQAGGTASLDR